MKKEEPEVRNKGLNFSLAPKWFPKEEIICSLEDGISALNGEDKELVRQECTSILRKARPPKRNLNHEKLKAIQSLRNNNEIVFLKADKGGTTMVMSRGDYVNKMKDHLYNSGSYKNLRKTLSLKL